MPEGTSNTNRRRRNVCDQSFKICHQKIVPVTPGAALQRQKPNSPQNHNIEVRKRNHTKYDIWQGEVLLGKSHANQFFMTTLPKFTGKVSVVFLLMRIHFEHGTPGPSAQFFPFPLAFQGCPWQPWVTISICCRKFSSEEKTVRSKRAAKIVSLLYKKVA